MADYGLDFISSDDLFKHVKDTVEKYRFGIDLDDFNSNLIDPIKLTFDSKVYRKTLEEIIQSECVRQIDKSNTNHIGYFHQNIFRYIGEGWIVPKQGYDIVNKSKHIYVELKNKHNTMNSSSAQKTYMKMQNTLLRDDQAVCFLVEVIARQSQDIPWVVSVDTEPFSHEKIRRISINKFYHMVTGDPLAFKKLCEKIPRVLEEVVLSLPDTTMSNTVLSELSGLSSAILNSLYLLAFRNYEGFDSLEF